MEKFKLVETFVVDKILGEEKLAWKQMEVFNWKVELLDLGILVFNEVEEELGQDEGE